MSADLVKLIATSKDAALVMSLCANVVLIGAVWRVWKSRENLQDRVTAMLTDLVKELAGITRRLCGDRDE